MMKRFTIFMIFSVVIFGSSCGSRREATNSATAAPNEHAVGYVIKTYDDYTTVEIKNPWRKGRLLQRYILVERGTPLPDKLPKGTIIRTPLENIIVYTSVHTSIIEKLGAGEKIIGVCEPQYISSKSIQEGISSGRIADVGSSSAPNIEKIIEIKGGVIIASPFENAGYGAAEKIGIPIIEAADYMENTPLGRTEWIKFYGLLLGKEAVADSLFNEVERSYNELRALATTSTSRPSVLVEKKYGPTWFLPAGESFMANLLKDAGADYLFKGLKGSGSASLSFETVLEKGINADYWLITYSAPSGVTNYSYNTLRGEYTPYEKFLPFRNRKIFGSDADNNTYFEDLTIHPDSVLNALIEIFHPELLTTEPNYPYWRPLYE